MRNPCLIAMTLPLAVASLSADVGSVAESADRALYPRSVVSRGDLRRLRRVLARAQQGEPITLGVIGGSITQGAAASRPERRYGNQLAAWLQAAFPAAAVAFVNAGIGATGSSYGALRAGRDLLGRRPDLVVVEYAVNDGNTPGCAETLEGLVRQILSQPNRPAVVLLFTMHRQGNNAQEWHGKVGAHYGLPMISFRDAFWPEIEAGRLAWEAVEADQVHPNDRGHAAMAQFLAALLDEVRQDPPAAGEPGALPPLPPPLLGDLFEHVSLREAPDLQPVANQGWEYDAQAKCWKSSTPGSTIAFAVDGQAVLTMHHVVKGPMGRAQVQVDDGGTRTLEGWFNQTWGGYRQTNEIARGLSPGPHTVRFVLLDDRHPDSAGSEFRILGLGTAGAHGRGGPALPPPEYRPADATAWDFWFARDGAAWFGFHLQAPLDKVPKWGHTSVGLAVSADLRHWVEHGEVLRANPPGQWNDARIATGSVWRHGDGWCMVFTAHGRNGGIGLARSRDLRTWTRVGDGPLTLTYRPFVVPDTPYWRDQGFAPGTVLTYRFLADPYVLPDPIDGWYVMAVNAAIEGEPENRRGCTGLLRSRDGLAWEDMGIIAAPRAFDRLETPQLWERQGRWYLYFGAACENPATRANWVYTAASMTGPFEPAPWSGVRLPDGRGYYIAKVVNTGKGDVFLACLGAERLSPPYPVTYGEDGALTLGLPDGP